MQIPAKTHGSSFCTANWISRSRKLAAALQGRRNGMAPTIHPHFLVFPLILRESMTPTIHPQFHHSSPFKAIQFPNRFIASATCPHAPRCSPSWPPPAGRSAPPAPAAAPAAPCAWARPRPVSHRGTVSFGMRGGDRMSFQNEGMEPRKGR